MPQPELDYAEIRYRLQNHGVFRFFRKDSAAFIIAFLLEAFKKRHRSDVPQGELASGLSAFIALVNLESGETMQAQDPERYLDEWADEGILRRYYASGSDEPRYDLTPEGERAIEWVRELTERQFVGTESRLLKIFDVLKDIVYGASFNVEERVAELEKRREEMDGEIARLKAGDFDRFDATRIKERYFELEDTARRLLSDFKQIEQNFRDLDRTARAERLTAERSRGSVLKDIFGLRDRIMASDQGRSFTAFWAFLMSAEKQEELSALVGRVQALADVANLPKTFPMEMLKPHLVEAGARVQRMTHRIHEELRRFLDERTREEGRRVAELAEEVRRLALEVRDAPPSGRAFLSVEGDPDVDMVMERPLYNPVPPVRIGSKPEEMGISLADTAALFQPDAVDIEELRGNIRSLLRDRPQVSLEEITRYYPIGGGVAELIGYFTLACGGDAATVDESLTVRVAVHNRRSGRSFAVRAPNLVFLAERAP